MNASGGSEEDPTILSKDTRYLSETQKGNLCDSGLDDYHNNNRQRGRVASYWFCYARLHKVRKTFVRPEIA
jgi:hypothetical protein